MTMTPRRSRLLVLSLLALPATGCPSSSSSQPRVHKVETKRAPLAATKAGPLPGPARDDNEADPAGPPLLEDGTLYGESTLMGTRVSIRVFVDNPQKSASAASAIESAMAEIARIESIASEWQADSDLSRLNRAEGQWTTVAPELVEILNQSSAISERTRGRFDVSFYAVGQLWKFHPGARPPSNQAIEAKLQAVDWRAIEIDDPASRVRLGRPGMSIGLGAIAKGYGVDRASELLVSRGWTNHIVEAGGDTMVRGSKGGRAWRVGIQDPKGGAPRRALEIEDQALVTSGNYLRFFEHKGRRYSHILDPATGWPRPESETPRSVSVIGPDAATADAYATAFSLMAREDAFALAEAEAGLELFWIGPDGSEHESSGLEALRLQTAPR